MKKAILIFTIISLTGYLLNAGEKIYISTDKQVYMAGGDIWYSLYCLNDENNRLSDLSKIAYIELHSAEGMVSTHKAGLRGGRGSGKITLSPNLPTGNYVLVGYTSVSAEEKESELIRKYITVFNSFSQETVTNGVEIVDETDTVRKFDINVLPINTKNILEVDIDKDMNAKTENRYRFSVKNLCQDPAYLNISIFHEDSLFLSAHGYAVENLKIADNYRPDSGIDYKKLEYEGEKIRIQVENYEGLEGKECFISTLGSGNNIYTSRLENDGTATFVTNNIYDVNEIFFAIKDSDNAVKAKVISPFRELTGIDIPKLYISSSIGDKIDDKGYKMQIEKRYGLNSLTNSFSYNEGSLLYAKPIIYKLDDYTRFHVMEELFIEYIYDARIRKDQGRPVIQVRCTDIYNSLYFSQYSLLFIDGIPVFDHKLFLDYDPLLIKEIRIYPCRYALGEKIYEGVLEVITYKGSAPGFKFDYASILSFNAPQKPVSYTGERLISGDRSTPDFRETIYWHPNIEIGGDSLFKIEYLTPAYSGNFRIVIEGITSKGVPLFFSDNFIVQ